MGEVQSLPCGQCINSIPTLARGRANTERAILAATSYQEILLRQMQGNRGRLLEPGCLWHASVQVPWRSLADINPAWRGAWPV
jgi:hypothetical protein